MSLEAMDRYAAQQERLRALADRMHHNLAPATDQDSLDGLLHVLGRVLFHGERIEVRTAQALAAAARVAEGVGEVVDGLGGVVEAVLGTGEGGDAPPAETPANSPETAERPPESTPPETMVVRKQAPPVAKPGRGRGFRLKGDAA